MVKLVFVVALLTACAGVVTARRLDQRAASASAKLTHGGAHAAAAAPSLLTRNGRGDTFTSDSLCFTLSYPFLLPGSVIKADVELEETVSSSVRTVRGVGGVGLEFDLGLLNVGIRFSGQLALSGAGAGADSMARLVSAFGQVMVAHALEDSTVAALLKAAGLSTAQERYAANRPRDQYVIGTLAAVAAAAAQGVAGSFRQKGTLASTASWITLGMVDAGDATEPGTLLAPYDLIMGELKALIKANKGFLFMRRDMVPTPQYDKPCADLAEYRSFHHVLSVKGPVAALNFLQSTGNSMMQSVGSVLSAVTDTLSITSPNSANDRECIKFEAWTKESYGVPRFGYPVHKFMLDPANADYAAGGSYFAAYSWGQALDAAESVFMNVLQEVIDLIRKTLFGALPQPGAGAGATPGLTEFLYKADRWNGDCSALTLANPGPAFGKLLCQLAAAGPAFQSGQEPSYEGTAPPPSWDPARAGAVLDYDTVVGVGSYANAMGNAFDLQGRTQAIAGVGYPFRSSLALQTVVEIEGWPRSQLPEGDTYVRSDSGASPRARRVYIPVAVANLFPLLIQEVKKVVQALRGSVPVVADYPNDKRPNGKAGSPVAGTGLAWFNMGRSSGASASAVKDALKEAQRARAAFDAVESFLKWLKGGNGGWSMEAELASAKSWLDALEKAAGGDANVAATQGTAEREKVLARIRQGVEAAKAKEAEAAAALQGAGGTTFSLNASWTGKIEASLGAASGGCAAAQANAGLSATFYVGASTAVSYDVFVAPPPPITVPLSAEAQALVNAAPRELFVFRNKPPTTVVSLGVEGKLPLALFGSSPAAGFVKLSASRESTGQLAVSARLALAYKTSASPAVRQTARATLVKFLATGLGYAIDVDPPAELKVTLTGITVGLLSSSLATTPSVDAFVAKMSGLKVAWDSQLAALPGVAEGVDFTAARSAYIDVSFTASSPLPGASTRLVVTATDTATPVQAKPLGGALAALFSSVANPGALPQVTTAAWGDLLCGPQKLVPSGTCVV